MKQKHRTAQAEHHTTLCDVVDFLPHLKQAHSDSLGFVVGAQNAAPQEVK